MPPIQGWFKSRKPLRASRKSYYEDIFGEKNPEEDLEGVHIIDSESDSDPGVFSRKARCQSRKKPKITLRNNKTQPDRGREMDAAGSNDIMAAPRIDRSTGTRIAEPKSDQGMLADKRSVVTIDDDDSDIEEQFVVDLHKHAQSLDNQNDEDDVEDPESNQKEIGAAFMAESKKYAAPPPRMDNQSNDELLEKINRRAESFANQSPLGPMESSKPGLDAATVLPSIENTNNRSAREALADRSIRVPDEPSDRVAVETLEDATGAGAVRDAVGNVSGRSSTAVVSRQHSWDPSQGSEYVYSDEEAVNTLEHAKTSYEGLRNDNDQHEDLYDTSDEDAGSRFADAAVEKVWNIDTHDSQRLGSEVQRNLSDEIAELANTRKISSVVEDDESQEVIDLTSPTRFSSEEAPIRRRRSFRRSTYGLSDHVRSTSSESEEPLIRKSRPFGLFASRPSISMEPELELSEDDTPPQRLRDLILKRHREIEERQVTPKKARYNLRPRGQPKDYSPLKNIASTVDKMDSETDEEVEEQRVSRRVTRSMTTNTSVKKPIPRFKAARKTAWAAMGITPKDDTYRRSYRQIVEVVIPRVVDRISWSSTSPPRIERRQSPVEDDDLVMTDGEQKLPAALAGKGMKRMILNSNIDGVQEVPFILVD